MKRTQMKRTPFKSKPLSMAGGRINKFPTRKKKAKRKKLPGRTTVVNALDKIFSILIRERDLFIFGGCPFKGLAPNDESSGVIECCFHFITRGKHITRWDPINAVGASNWHNKREQNNPDDYRAWYVRNYGLDRYELLVRRSHNVADFGTPVLRELLEAIKAGGLDGIACALAEIHVRRNAA